MSLLLDKTGQMIKTRFFGPLSATLTGESRLSNDKNPVFWPPKRHTYRKVPLITGQKPGFSDTKPHKWTASTSRQVEQPKL
jgi:hypothetical protein